MEYSQRILEMQIEAMEMWVKALEDIIKPPPTLWERIRSIFKLSNRRSYDQKV